MTTEADRLRAAIQAEIDEKGAVTKDELRAHLRDIKPDPEAAPVPPAPTPPAPAPPMPAPAPSPVPPPATDFPWAKGREVFCTPIPTDPKLDLYSAALAPKLTQGSRVLLTRDYTSPEYVVTDDADPLFSVARGNLVVHFPDSWGRVDIQALEFRCKVGAMPAPGQDAWLTFTDHKARTMTGLWHSRWEGGVLHCDSGGQFPLDGPPWTTAVAYNDSDYWRAPLDALQAAGHIRAEDRVTHPWLTPLTQSTASGVHIRAGVVTAEDLARGEINHALALTVNFGLLGGPPRMGPFRFPAHSTDGHGAPFDPTRHFIMGSRLQRNPALRVDHISNPGVRMIAKAFQVFGGYVIDSGGSTASVVCELANTPEKKAVYDRFGFGAGEGYIDASQVFDDVRVLNRWDGT